MLIRGLVFAGALLAALEPIGDSTRCGEELCGLIAAGNLPELRWPDFADQHGNISRLYESTHYQPIWVRDNAPTAQALAVIAVLEGATVEGLDPQDFDAGRWQARIADLQKGALSKNSRHIGAWHGWMERVSAPSDDRASPVLLSPARFDLELTVSAMRYASCLRFGYLNPHPNTEGFDLAAWLGGTLAVSNDPAAALQQLDPPSEDYQGLKAALANYERIAGDDTGEKLPYSKKPVEALNTPPVDRVQKLQLAMERLRWLPREVSQRSIVVNIPEFRLRALDASGKTELQMKVVVGKAQSLQTPGFSAHMKDVIFRPYWNVPPSIQVKEFIPEIQKDPSYLTKNDYEVTDSRGKVVSSGAVSGGIMEGLRSGRLQIRQRPGPRNALGGVKFVLPNEHDVYFHDTPARQLFAKSRRDFSHGCIRLENALELAVWVLRDRPEWTRERIQATMQGGKTIEVPLPQPIPVRIEYQTAAVGEDGSVYFFDDIYGLDEALEKQLTTGGFGPRPRG